MKHKFVWEVPATEPLKAQLPLWDALERAMTYDRHMSNAVLVAEEGRILVEFHYEGRDRWWIHSRARTAVIAATVRAKLPHRELKLIRIERLDTGHDNKGSSRTEAQHAADRAKTRAAQWERARAARASEAPRGSSSEESPSSVSAP